ncbi:MAG TPA: BatD family protein [Thermoanaerobaculia bacterium]|nr:BatD family protein [Thermoanaerobaculia bacterium]
MTRRVVLCVAMFAVMGFAAKARANDLTVDSRTVQQNDTVTITLSLEGPFASLDEVQLPLRNLVLVGQPFVSSEYSWINGESMRRKVFQYHARGVAPGPAQVGPVSIDAPDGQHETLTAIALQVLADRASASNDPEVVLRELLATGRDPFFIAATVDRDSVYVGESLVVTWWLYNAASVQQWQVGNVPRLEEFWAEEIDVRNAQPDQQLVGGVLMQHVPIRRVALFPLRSGALTIGGMTLDAAVMRPTRRGPFDLFEGTLIESSYTAAPLTIHVKPLPDGPPVDAVGELALQCSAPRQRNGGPVAIDVTLTGRANLRSVPAPHFDGKIAANVQIENGKVSVASDGENVTMTRRWTLLLLPQVSAPLIIPPMIVRTFSPVADARKDLRCEGTTFDAQLVGAAGAPARRPPSADEGVRRSNVSWWIVGAALVVAFLAMLVPFTQRALKSRREIRTLIANRTPAEIREAIDARLPLPPHVLLSELSDRGDAYRAVRSLLEARERERELDVSDRELARRIRELLTIVG